MEFRIVSVPSSLCINAVHFSNLPMQSPTYNKYYTYLTYVWCRHVLFMAFDSKIIGEKCVLPVAQGFCFCLQFYCAIFFFFNILLGLLLPWVGFRVCVWIEGCKLLFEHVCKITSPTNSIFWLFDGTREKCVARNDCGTNLKATFTVMTIALNWGQHIAVDSVGKPTPSRGSTYEARNSSDLIAFNWNRNDILMIYEP